VNVIVFGEAKHVSKKLLAPIIKFDVNSEKFKSHFF